MKNMYNYMTLYPWFSELTENILKGDMDRRLPLQKDNGKTLSVLLNGPSLTETVQYLDRSKTDVMMVNDSVKTDLYREIKPEYFCLADFLYFRPIKENYMFFKRMEEINSDVTLFYPSNFIQSVILWGRDFNICPVYAVSKFWDVEAYSCRLLRQNLISPYFINVGIMALYVGIQLGYKDIILHGADLSIFKDLSVNEDMQVEAVIKHYYEKEPKKINQTQLFRRSYNMTHEMRTLYQTFAHFSIIAKYAADIGVRILNMSRESMLDCFEKYRG